MPSASTAGEGRAGRLDPPRPPNRRSRRVGPHRRVAARRGGGRRGRSGGTVRPPARGAPHCFPDLVGKPVPIGDFVDVAWPVGPEAFRLRHSEGHQDMRIPPSRGYRLRESASCHGLRCRPGRFSSLGPTAESNGPIGDHREATGNERGGAPFRGVPPWSPASPASPTRRRPPGSVRAGPIRSEPGRVSSSPGTPSPPPGPAESRCAGTERPPGGWPRRTRRTPCAARTTRRARPPARRPAASRPN